MKKSILILTTLLLGAFQSKAIVFKGHLLFTSKLNGSQVVPSVSSGANGVASFMLNKTRDSLTINLSMIGLSGPAVNVSLYQGNEGANGSSLINLTPFLNGNRLTTDLAGTNVTGMISKLMSDNLYLVVTTAANPTGEIRGQVKLEADWNFVADMNSMETVPMMMNSAYGLGSFGLSHDKQTLSFRIVCQKLNGPITNAELRFGDYGVAGNLAANISSFITGVHSRIVTGTISTNPQLLDSLLSGRVYLNISTAALPTGALRSQLINRKGLSFDANPIGSQMVPAITSIGQAVAVLRLSSNLDTLYFDAVADSLSSNLDYAHMHIGNAGAPYGAVQVDFTPFIAGRRVKGMISGLAGGSTTYRMLVSNVAFVFHTSLKPNGELRGQIIRYAREGYKIHMSGNQVVPAVTSPAYGSGIVSTSRFDDNAHYVWNAGSLSATATGAHFHKNKIGMNGVQIYDMTGMMQTSGTDVSAEGYWNSTDATPFLPANSLQFSKDSIYLDIHNAAFPNGEIRGQVLSGYSSSFTITSLLPQTKNDVSVSLMPNPAQNEITIHTKNRPISSVEVLSIYGQVIYKSSTDKTGSETIATIDLSNYTNGIYFIRINGSDFSVLKKVIKE
ncbi:MAG: CHRD domain-containing protein [Bacteroidota bacterium]